MQRGRLGVFKTIQDSFRNLQRSTSRVTSGSAARTLGSPQTHSLVSILVRSLYIEILQTRFLPTIQ